MGLSTEDLMEIDRLVARYCYLADAGDGSGFAACFTPTAKFFQGKDLLAEGQEQLEEFGSTLGAMRLRHVTTSALPEGDGDTASCRAYCTVFTSSPGDGYSVMTQGIYTDKLEKTAEGWRFSERRFQSDLP